MSLSLGVKAKVKVTGSLKWKEGSNILTVRMSMRMRK